MVGARLVAGPADESEAMTRLVLTALVVLVAIGALLAGALPHSATSIVHDAGSGWHWATEQLGKTRKR